MGLITRILSFTRTFRNNSNVSDVKVDPGGGANLTCENMSPCGDDAPPLLTDFAVVVPIQRTGGKVVVGYLDGINVQKSNPGDKRNFARDASTGLDVVELWLKNDGSGTLSNANGSVTLEADGSFTSTTSVGTLQNSSTGLIKGDNGSGFFQLLPNGDFDANGFIFTAGGSASGASVSATSVMAAGKELAGHDHPVTTAPGTTGPRWARQ